MKAPTAFLFLLALSAAWKWGVADTKLLGNRAAHVAAPAFPTLHRNSGVIGAVVGNATAIGMSHHQRRLASCETGWELHVGKCYSVITAIESWKKTQQACQVTVGADLASIVSTEEVRALRLLPTSHQVLCHN